MEHNAVVRSGSVRHSTDGLPLWVAPRVPTTDDDDRGCSALIKFKGCVAELPRANGLEQWNQVTLHSRHHCFCLRIAHTAVKFNHEWLVSAAHQTAVQESSVSEVLL